MKPATVGRTATAIIGLVLAGTMAAPAQAASPALSAQPSLARAAAGCPTGNICLWRNRNFSGVPWKWSPGDGYRTVPSNMRNHVFSFYANASGCFIDTNSRQRRSVRPGHYAKAYDTNFGTLVDAIARTC